MVISGGTEHLMWLIRILQEKYEPFPQAILIFMMSGGVLFKVIRSPYDEP